jgi:hypothetical protein
MNTKMALIGNASLPSIQLMQQLSINGFEDPQKMNEQGFPYTKFNLMHEIHNKQLEEV